MTVAILIAAAFLLLGGVAYVKIRNAIIGERNRCEEAWSAIDVQLKRRHDLVPNLVETVKGYAPHERDLFAAVSEARAQAMQKAGVAEAARAEQQLSGALAELRAVSEDYPQLRASENFQQLSADLARIEAEIQSSRKSYNADARAYNTKIQVFPNSIVARSGGFRAREYFEIEDAGERGSVSVQFGNGNGG